MNTQPKKAISYLRSAIDNQESLDAQESAAKQFCQLHNIELIHIESDKGISGLTEERPGFKCLIEDWIMANDAPDYQYIIMRDISRIGRFSLIKMAYYDNLFATHGKEVVYLDRQPEGK